MSARDVIAYVLLGSGVGLELVAAVGLVAMQDVYDRLHYVGPATVGAVLVASAVAYVSAEAAVAVSAIQAVL